MRSVLYLGQKPIGEKCFELLLKAKSLEIRAAVSNDHTDVWWQSNKIFKIAKEKDIPFISNKERNNKKIENIISKYSIDTIISVQHSWILPSLLLSMVNGFAFNLHNAKLPDYKGYNTYSHAILNGEGFYTSTIHWIVEQVDTGAIAFEKSFKVDAEDTAKSLYIKAEDNAEKVFEEFIEALSGNKQIPKKALTSTGCFYSCDSLDGLREIRDMDNYEEVDRKSRAFYFPPFEPAFSILNGKKNHIYPKTKQ